MSSGFLPPAAGSTPASSSSSPLHPANNGAPRHRPVRRDMHTMYQRKVDNCDRRIRRLEEQIRAMEEAEQRAKERQLQRQQAAGGGGAGAAADGSPASPKKISREEEDKMIMRLTYVKERDDNALFPPIDNTRPAKLMWEKLRPDREDEDEEEEVDIEAMVERLGVDDVEMRYANTEQRLEDVEANGANAMWRESVRQISIARRRHMDEEVDEDEDDDEELYVLSEERMAALGNRLCNESLQHKEQVMADLEEKYYGADVNKSVEIERSKMKRLQAGVKVPTPQELGQRLHDESRAKKSATMASLEAKYIESNSLIRDKHGELKVLPKLSKSERDDLVNRLSTTK